MTVVLFVCRAFSNQPIRNFLIEIAGHFIFCSSWAISRQIRDLWDDSFLWFSIRYTGEWIWAYHYWYKSPLLQCHSQKDYLIFKMWYLANISFWNVETPVILQARVPICIPNAGAHAHHAPELEVFQQQCPLTRTAFYVTTCSMEGNKRPWEATCPQFPLTSWSELESSLQAHSCYENDNDNPL